MIRQKAFFTIMIALGCAALGRGQATAAFDSSVVETGESFRLSLTVQDRFGVPAEVGFEVWKDFFPEENILEKSGWRNENGHWLFSADLIAFDADTLSLPPLPIAMANGDTVYAATPELVVRATPAPDELIDMSDIRDIHPERAVWTDFLPWILGVALLLALAVAAYFALRLLESRRSRMSSRTVALPPHLLALRRLEALQRKNLPAEGRLEAYYRELSFVLRAYLESRYEFPALESVAADITRELQGEDFPGDLLEALKTFLYWSDLAKFAKAHPPDSYHQTAMDLAYRIINTTTQTAPDTVQTR